MKKAAFNKLQAKWYAKLAKSGFEDVEFDETHFKRGTAAIDQRYGGPIESKIQYYQMATYFLNDYDFKDKIQEIIWEYHANGMSARSISETLNRVRRKKIDPQTVWTVIRDLRVLMKKMYGVTK